MDKLKYNKSMLYIFWSYWNVTLLRLYYLRQSRRVDDKWSHYWPHSHIQMFSHSIAGRIADH